MTTEQEMSEEVLIFGSLGSLVVMIGGCVVGFVACLFRLGANLFFHFAIMFFFFKYELVFLVRNICVFNGFRDSIRD